MKYKLLGKSGLRVSEIALGTLNFGEKKDWGVDADESRAILSAFTEAGGTVIDTAPNYAGGASELQVGEFVGSDRANFVLSTKYTANNGRHILAGGNSARTMIRSVEESLGRLKTDYIDLFWLHYWDGTTPLEEILRGFEHLYSTGKVRYFGFSDTPAWLVSRAVTMAELRGWARPVSIQVQYNPAARDAERELLPMADAMDLGVMCWGPLAAGVFAASGSPKRQDPSKVPRHIRTCLEGIISIGEASGHTPIELALRWLLRRKERQNLIPIIGARTAEQLRSSLLAADGELADQLIGELNSICDVELGFPHDLINSPYLRRLAFGDKDAALQNHVC